jgi:hypothetical protein
MGRVVLTFELQRLEVETVAFSIFHLIFTIVGDDLLQ